MNMGNSIRGFPGITTNQFSKDFYDSVFLKVLAHFLCTEGEEAGV